MQELRFEFTDNYTPTTAPASATFAFLTEVKAPLFNGQQYSARLQQYDRYLGKPLVFTDINGATTGYSYIGDALDRIRQVTRPDGGTTIFSYDDTALTVTKTQSLNSCGLGNVVIAATVFDGFGRRAAERTSAPECTLETQFRYDAKGRLEQVSNPSCMGGGVAWTTTSFDALDRVKSVVYPDGSTARTEYVGLEETSRDPDQRWKKLVRDVLGRTVQVVEDPAFTVDASWTNPLGLGVVTEYEYDPLDNLTLVRQVKDLPSQATIQQTRTFQYDSLSRLRQATQPETNTVWFWYDDQGNLTQRQDGRITVGFDAYDAWDRPVRKYYSGGPTPEVRYCYDGRGYGAGGVCVGNTVAGQIGKLTGVGTAESGTNFGYDVLGRVVTSAQATNGRSYAFGYRYDQMDQLENVRYPSGREVRTCRDGVGRVSTVKGTKTGVEVGYASVQEYWPHGAMKTVRFGDPLAANPLTQTTTFNNRLQPTGVSVLKGSTLWNMVLEYTDAGTNNNGNVRRQTVNAAGAGGISYMQSYTYDRFNRLELVTENPSLKRKFGCDRVGNCWVDRNNSPGFAPENFTPETLAAFDGANRMAGYGYDLSGNQTAMGANAMTYDAENRLRESTINGVTFRYVYDGAGQRVMKLRRAFPGAAETVESVYVYDAQGQLAVEQGPRETATAGCTTC
ncbi:MAG: hypothetical protein K1X67_26865, partial [Fimbriimonadaceae bacterium]|nr:hypothetical protein [Fimbriimonadaceae bacterium]